MHGMVLEPDGGGRGPGRVGLTHAFILKQVTIKESPQLVYVAEKKKKKKLRPGIVAPALQECMWLISTHTIPITRHCL